MGIYPGEYRINEVWILFKLTGQPIAVREGAFHYVGLMDAASCFILCLIPSPADKAVSKIHLQDLVKRGWIHKKAYPSRLLVATELLNADVEAEAQSKGISVLGVPESQLKSIIGEAQDDFRKRFG